MKEPLDHPLDQAIEALAERALHLFREDEEIRVSIRNLVRAACITMGEDMESPENDIEESETLDQGAAPPPENEDAQEPQTAPPLETKHTPLSPGWAFGEKSPVVAPPPQEPPRTLVYSTDPGDRHTLLEVGQGIINEDEWEPTIGQMETISEALTVKAEASIFVLELFHNGIDSVLDDDDARARQDMLIDKTRGLGNCFLWMLKHARPRPETASDWQLLVHNFQTSAAAARLLARQCELNQLDNDSWKELLTLCAQAQSALRANVTRTGQQFDVHQLEFFKWIRRFAKLRHHYIERFMREEDVAVPEEWPALLKAIESFESRARSKKDEQKERKNLEGKLRYHIQQLARCTNGQTEDEWMKIMLAVDGLVNMGVPPSDVSLREPLLPLIDDIPEMEQEPHGFELVMREIDTYLSRIPTESYEPLPESAAPPEILAARSLLAGKTVVLIGGEPRNLAKRALEEAFQLKELDWVLGKHHQSILDFRPNIVRDETALVILAIRWSSHSFSDVKAFCDEAAKPLVRLPGGYNPNQVAHQVLHQVGDILSKAQSA